MVATAHAGAAIVALIGLMMPPPPPPPPPGGWSGHSSHPTGQDLVAIKKAKAEEEVNALAAPIRSYGGAFVKANEEPAVKSKASEARVLIQEIN